MKPQEVEAKKLELEMLGFGVPYFNTFFLKEPLWNKSLYFFLPGYLKAQFKGSFKLKDRVITSVDGGYGHTVLLTREGIVYTLGNHSEALS